MTAIDEIKQRIEIVELVSQSVKLRRSGKSYTGFCPFHANTRTPAFVVFPDSGTWRCFGQCNEGGDIFRFVMKKEGWDFATTLRYLAEKAGVQLEAPTPERAAEEETHARIRGLLEDAVTLYRHHLTQTPAGKPAFDYLLKRGLTPNTIEQFGLGYAPPGWENTLGHFTKKGFTPDELLQAGLVSEKEGGGVRDRFHNRIMFPIRDGIGKMTGFGARILDPNDVPKFLNSPQTALFDKGRLLYGLDQARKTIRTIGQAVIVEGYLDVIALHQAGFANAVSPMGTALTEDQFRLLKRFTRRLILALDPDSAGEKATLRGLELAREAMDHSEEVIFDARGLLRSEARLQADVLVASLPEGRDPDEVALADPEEWQRIVSSAKPIVVHVMDTLARSRDLNDPKEKREIARQVLPLINDVPNPVERDDYRQKLARLLKVDESALASTQPQPGSTRSRRRPTFSTQEGTRSSRMQPLDISPELQSEGLEKHVLGLLLLEPGDIFALDRALQSAGLTRFGAGDFELSANAEIAAILLRATDQDEMDTADFIASQTPPSLQGVAAALKTAIPEGISASKRLEDLIRTVFFLRQVRVNLEIDRLRFLQQEPDEENGSGKGEDFNRQIAQAFQIRARLDAALSKPIILD
jgi:DNA primase